VAAWPTYPHWQPKEKVFDKLLILEDTDGDGRADRCKTFADGLHCPTGFEFARGGVLVAQAPDLMLLRDTDGDDQADVRIRVLSGLDSADTHHTSNSFRLGPGGDLFFQEGTFHHSQVETPYGPPVRLANAGVFRYEPRAQKFEVYISYPFANPHGHVFDRWGQDFVTDGTGNVNYFAAPFSGHVAFPDKHREYRPFFAQRTRPCAATEILSSRHFPEDWQGDYLVANVIGFQGIHRYRVTESGAGFSATEAEPIVYSTDPNFRPVDIEMGPDGALYFLEWQNPIIGHMQHNLRDPSRDRTHGRVYRVSHKDRPPLRAPAIAGQPIETLLELLKAPEDRVRYRAKIELGERDSSQVITAVGTWLGALDANDPEYEHHRLEALWVHQYHDVVDLDLLDRVLKSADGRARAAATRVLCYWRDRVPDALDRLKSLAADPHPRVRLEAVRAASFFPTAEAIEIALVTAEHPSDLFLDYCRSETMRTLDPYWRRAVADGRMIRFSSEAGARFFLRNLAVEDLLKLPRSRGVDLEIVLRQGVAEPSRRAALDRLATEGGRTPAGELIELLRSRFSAVGGSVLDESIAIELSNLFSEPDRADLSAQRGELEAFAQSGKSASLRALAFALLTTADASADPSWEMARSQPGRLRNLLEAIPMMSDPRFRSSLGQRVLALLEDTPEFRGAMCESSCPVTNGRSRSPRWRCFRKARMSLVRVGPLRRTRRMGAPRRRPSTGLQVRPTAMAARRTRKNGPRTRGGKLIWARSSPLMRSRYTTEAMSAWGAGSKGIRWSFSTTVAMWSSARMVRERPCRVPSSRFVVRGDRGSFAASRCAPSCRYPESRPRASPRLRD
jgi:HEAT repeat protein